jgi:ABC-type glycerol-3-phosphate transport system permease component
VTQRGRSSWGLAVAPHHDPLHLSRQYDTSYNLLFADILLITIPPLLLFLFFQRQIVAGLTAGSVKG